MKATVSADPHSCFFRTDIFCNFTSEQLAMCDVRNFQSVYTTLFLTALFLCSVTDKDTPLGFQLSSYIERNQGPCSSVIFCFHPEKKSAGDGAGR